MNKIKLICKHCSENINKKLQDYFLDLCKQMESLTNKMKIVVVIVVGLNKEFQLVNMLIF